MQKSFEIAFLLFPGFPLLEFAAAIKTLETANSIADDCFSIRSCSSEPDLLCDISLTVKLPCELSPDLSTGLPDEPDAVVLLADSSEFSGTVPDLPADALLAGIGGGANLLARQDLLNGVRASLAGSPFDLCFEFPEVNLCQHRCVLDQKRITCQGNLSSFSLALELIANLHSQELAQKTAISLNLPDTALFAFNDPKQAFSKKQPQINEAIELMQANIEEPLGADELASLVGISRRQLERLFRKHLDTVPSKYYLKLRLEQARKLLLETTISVVEVGVACGFSNASHFSTAYKNHFKKTPREDRL